MRCDDVARILPEAVEGGAAVELSVQRHIEHCLRCQAELARYRKMLRGLQLLRTRYLEPAPGSARADPRRHRGGRRAPGRPFDPVGPPPRLRRCHRRCRGRGRYRGHGDDPPPFPAAHPSRHELTAQCRRGPGSVPTNAGDASGRPAHPLLSFCLRPDRARRAVAQLVEHRSPKPAVGGSSPSCPAANDDLNTSIPKDGAAVAMNRQTKRMMAKQGTDKPKSRGPTARSGDPRPPLPPGRRSVPVSTCPR